MRMTIDYTISIISNGGKSLHEFYCTTLGIIATVISLIDILGGTIDA